MTRFHFAMAIAVIAAIPVAAQAQAPKPAAPAVAASPPAVPGVSAQGNAVIARIQKQGDPIGRDATAKLRALLPQISQTALAPTVDVEKFAGLLKQQDTLASQLSQRRTEMMVTILRQLPPADRGPFLKAIATRLPAGAAQPAR